MNDWHADVDLVCAYWLCLKYICPIFAIDERRERAMNRFHLVPVVVCFCVVCALFNGAVYALDQDELTVSVSWMSEALYPGDNVMVSIFLINNCADELTIYYVGIHVDWMSSNRFFGYDLSDDPASVSGYGSYAFSSITLSIPENATAGEHSYFVGMDGLQGDSTSFSWDSMTLTVMIQDSEAVYNELVATVEGNITEAVNAEYRSSEAKSLLEDAETAYNQALALADEQSWEEAILLLQSASTYLEQAYAEEQNYVEPESPQEPLLLILGVVSAVVVVVAVLVIIFVVRRKGKQTAPVDQPTDA